VFYHNVDNFPFFRSGGSTEKLLDQPSIVIQPVTPPSATPKSSADFLSTSGTFEKVPSPAPESFEQISMSQMQESRVTPPSLSTESSVAAAESQLPASTATQPPVPAGRTLISAQECYKLCSFQLVLFDKIEITKYFSCDLYTPPLQ